MNTIPNDTRNKHQDRSARTRRSLAVVLTASMLTGFVAPARTLAKKVICVDDGAKGDDSVFNSNHEGWERDQMVDDDVIQVGGSLTDCLDQVVDGDTIIIIAHGTQTTNAQGEVVDTGFNWGQDPEGDPVNFTGFGNGADEMPVPADFAQLDNVSVEFCSCWSAKTPDGGTSVKDDLVGEMGGKGNSGEGFTGVAQAAMSPNWSAASGTAQKVVNAVLTQLGAGDWAENPPGNRPDADNPDPNNTTQQSAAQAIADAKSGGAVTITIKYTEPTDCGNNVRAGVEDCDGTDDDACPGQCRADCTCPPQESGLLSLGPDIVWGCSCEEGRGCGIGTATFNPPSPVCGNNITEAGEECDGLDDAACPLSCLVDCTCEPPPVCGDNMVNQPSEECDGTDDAVCPGMCREDCTCKIVVSADTCATAVAPGTATDPCTDAIPTGPLGSCTSGGGVLDTWYTFIATATSARIRTDLNSSGTDSDYVVFHSVDGTCGGIDIEVGCSEDESGYLGDISIEKLVVGDTYYVQLGSWADSCSGGYVLDVDMPSTDGICGNGVIDAFGEQCDGADDDDCPTLCTATCNCPPPGCGNNVTEVGEECDGADDVACLIGCADNCTCNAIQTPALPAWGVVGLALMLLGGGAFAFRRRRAA